ncbi:MAG: insulinase family protein [Verrucomicrobiota bacterium]|nr:insulinase family protein [Verrucomicrobiota bacterium]
MPKLFLRLLLLGALSTASLHAKSSPPVSLPFPQEGSDLKADPAAKFGKLSNGFRYVILPNHEPKGRASLRLLVLAGSLNERQDQRGLAHFLEHMAFNGSEHYPPGTLIEFFQRMGMSLGGDTNANTSFDRTVYQLELAHNDDASLAEGLRVFRDYAGGLLLSEDEINKERGIIQSERRASDSVGYRIFVAQFEAMLGSTLLPKRLPIGDPEVVTNATRERFTDFWNTWYRPEKMVAVIVGDFPDPAAVEKMVKSAFEKLSARAPARPDPSLGELPTLDGVRPIYHSDPEAPVTSVSIVALKPYAREQDTAAREIKQLPRALVVAMLNRRLEILAKKENAPFVAGHASVSEQFNFLRESGIGLTCKPEQWNDALAAGEGELRRALEHGFTAAELREAVANLTNHFEQAVKTAGTRRSNALAEEIVRSLEANEVFLTPADELALAKPALEKITPADCLAAMRENFGGDGRFVAVLGNAVIPGDAHAAIMSAYEQAHSVAVAAPAADAGLIWAYHDFGPAGEIARREHVPDLDLDLVTFRNGVRLNLKKTDFEAGRVLLQARIGDGAITEPPNQRGLANVTARTFLAGGLGKHSSDDLRDIFAGRNVGWQFAPDPDALRFSGATTPDDLPLEFQLLAAEMTDPGYRPEALRVARKELEQTYLSFAHTPAGPVATEIANLIASGDPRFGMPPLQTMLVHTVDEVKGWMTPQLSRGAVEVGLVGDVDVEAAIDAAAKTIGALPPREEKPALAELKKVRFPAEPFTKDYTIESEIPKGALLIYWPTDDAIDIRRSRRFVLLAGVLSDRLRLKVREEIGATYSPRAVSNASDVFPGYGYLMASVDVDPAAAAKMSELVINLADDLARNGVTDDELNRARQPLLTALRESQRTNGYWVTSVLNRAQSRPEFLEAARTRISDVESVTPAELSALAGKYLGREHASRATILPTTPATSPNEK